MGVKVVCLGVVFIEKIVFALQYYIKYLETPINLPIFCMNACYYV